MEVLDETGLEAAPLAFGAAAPLVLAAVPLGVPLAVLQTTWLGTWTPLAWQICEAKVMAFCWSSALQPPGLARQHEMSLMKELLLQMHLASRPQSPMPFRRNEFAQSCC